MTAGSSLWTRSFTILLMGSAGAGVRTVPILEVIIFCSKSWLPGTYDGLFRHQSRARLELQLPWLYISRGDRRLRLPLPLPGPGKLGTQALSLLRQPTLLPSFLHRTVSRLQRLKPLRK